MREEVHATDVLRVGRMMEDLVQGGDQAVIVLDSLAAGPKGEDEENDRVHHLIALLQQPEPVVESASYTPAAAESVDGQAEQSYTDAALAESVEAAVEAVPENAVVSTGPTEENTKANGAVGYTPGFINFLQADELNGEVDDEQVEEAVGETSRAAPDVQTSAPQTQPAPVTVDQVVSEATAPAPVSLESTAPSSTHWANMDEEELGVPTPVSDAAVGTDSAAPSSAPSKSGKNQRRQRKPKQKKEGQEGKEGKQAEGQAGQAVTPASGEKKQGKPREQNRERKPREKKPAPVEAGQKVVDDDGFEMKVRQPSSSAPSRGAGGGGANGRRGRGRGGATNGSGSRSPANPGQNGGARGGKEGAGGGKKTQGGEKTSQPKPKPSILKAVQPTGPKSAPVF